MAEQPLELRRINWSELFPFTNVFRTFRMAIHPSKIGLALAALILTGLWGSILDKVWHSPALPDEINAYWQVPDIDAWRNVQLNANGAQLAAIRQEIDGKPHPDVVAAYKSNPWSAVRAAQAALHDNKGDLTAGEKARLAKAIQALRPLGIFKSFFSYEAGTVRDTIESAASLNFTGNWHEVLMARRTGAGDAPRRGSGVLACLILMARGKQWLLFEHCVYAVLFGAVTLAIWSLFGGAICRMAALNVARDERVSPQLALAFSRRKLLGFFMAPLLPVAIVAGLGILIAVVSLVIVTIPYLGEILGGLGMILAIGVGFVLAMVIIGATAGGSLMWPTIAVEGSDSFDAISRSYSYVLTRPWKAGFYAAVTLVYGAVCYLFARFFVLIVLKAVRFFVALGLTWTPRPGAGPGATKIDTIWPDPSFANLRGSHVLTGAMHWEPAGAWLISLWVLLVTAALGAFLISFYFSGSTIIYYLLRREVDATDLEDVYLEDDEANEAAPPLTPPAPAVAVEPAPSAPTAPPLAEGPAT